MDGAAGHKPGYVAAQEGAVYQLRRLDALIPHKLEEGRKVVQVVADGVLRQAALSPQVVSVLPQVVLFHHFRHLHLGRVHTATSTRSLSGSCS